MNFKAAWQLRGEHHVLFETSLQSSLMCEEFACSPQVLWISNQILLRDNVWMLYFPFPQLNELPYEQTSLRVCL